MIGNGAKGAECQSCRGPKRVKLIATGVKWKNQGHRRPCWWPASLQVEACRWKVVHALAHGGVLWRENRRVDHWLMSGFLLTGRSGLDTLVVGSLAKDVVISGKVHRKNFLATEVV